MHVYIYKMGLNETLFGPLGKNWCSLFYVFSVIYFFLFVLMMILTIFYMFGKNPSKRLAFLFFTYSATPFLGYFIMRILHGMCIK